MVTSRSCRTRSSLACIGPLMLATSSRNRVPPSLVWKKPARLSSAPEKAPLTWPNKELSSRASGIPAVFTGTKGADARPLE